MASLSVAYLEASSQNLISYSQRSLITKWSIHWLKENTPFYVPQFCGHWKVKTKADSCPPTKHSLPYIARNWVPNHSGRMRSNRLSLTPSGNWRAGNDDGTSSPDRDRHWNSNSTVPRTLYPGRDEDRSLYAPWRLFEERVRNGPYALTRFPLQPHSPRRILVIRGGEADRVNPRLRQFLQDSPPRIRGEWHLGPASEPEDPGLSDEEFKKAMKKIRKHIYNPRYPRRRAWKRGLFSRRSSNLANEEADEKDEEQQCTICLEAFVPSEQVMMTPCNHMFHNDCLVPWVKGHGKCPVCRYVLCERSGTALARSVGGNNNYYGSSYEYSNVGPVSGDDDLPADFIWLLRAMEEAFNWITYTGPGSYR